MYLKKITIVLCGLILFITSCKKDFLNPNNPSTINQNDVWKDPALLGLYVNNVYSFVPGWDYNTYNNIADEARSNYSGGPNSILVGQWNEVDNPMDIWVDTYKQIRVTNDFFANITTSTVSDDIKKLRTAEVRFLRALFYFNLLKRYGGIPLITKAQSLGDDLMVTRNTADECFKFIIDECTTAAADLPKDADRGRATKGAALSLKTRALLYFASPLFNPSNDLIRWQNAASAAKDVIDLGKYDLYPDLKQLWLDKSNAHKEIIFEKQYHLPETSHGWDAEVKPVWLANGDAGQCSPLQKLVDAFPMKNGKRINETASGYDPSKPYANRDDRFNAFIAHNQSIIAGIPSRPYPGVAPGQLTKSYGLSIYKGGSDYDSVANYAVYNTITGYLTIKATNPDNIIYRYGYGSEQPWIEFRYTEILLDYCEAINEAQGAPDANVYAYLNRIRQRGGIVTPLTMGLSQSDMRDLIRNERYIELCFEGQRYWDLRRWKMAESVLNGKKFDGVIITKQGPGNFTYQYAPVDLQPAIFEQKMYFMPIPKTEITKNPKLEQNTGWPK
ncbi:RagB/SusD family nutrient uptake outer membrane protein [Pedobacter nototheniae]|uniref:RagB/SusD family nutrient uptake outer membrane protein n=1 Tax=Pedobacter nototheniae TaxID=2488994 RepID=UPI0029317107|nr:RagB/SusD family nutrient uptake outer membrane protein [Pedobacter nototheniae]